MTCTEPVFYPDALKRVEAIYRWQLTEDPADPIARVSLAWCLFMQALLRAGQESVLEAPAQMTDSRQPCFDEAMRAVLDQNAADLLEDCLRQAMTVKQLTSDPDAQVNAERIVALVRLSSSRAALDAAEDRAASILNDLTRQVRKQHEPRERQLRRMPTNKPHREP